MLAFDTGPGSVMIDHVMRAKYGRPYDKNGEIARTGKVDEALMAQLKDHDSFKRPIPRSAWRLDFGSTYADQNQLANNIPAASGATRFGILGKLVQPPRLARL